MRNVYAIRSHTRNPFEHVQNMMYAARTSNVYKRMRVYISNHSHALMSHAIVCLHFKQHAIHDSRGTKNNTMM